MHRDRHRRSRIDLRKFFDRERVAQVVDVRAAIGFGHEHPHEPDRVELAVEFARKHVLAIPAGNVRRDLGLREFARRGGDGTLLLRRLESARAIRRDHRASIAGTAARFAGAGAAAPFAAGAR